MQLRRENQESETCFLGRPRSRLEVNITEIKRIKRIKNVNYDIIVYFRGVEPFQET
jgi:hypothetical protein